jgi:hypothetical protein
MIGYFYKAGDIYVGEAFHKYQKGFGSLLHQYIDSKKYGIGVDLILIEYNLEGKFLKLPDHQYEVNRYRRKEKALSVKVYVPQVFGTWSENEKRSFITNTTVESVRLLEKRYEKSDVIQIDFKRLLLDLEKCAELFFQMQL